MDYASQYLNGLKTQGMGFDTPNVNNPVNPMSRDQMQMGFPQQAQQFGGSINDMIGQLSQRNQDLKKNNYFADLLKQTGGALLRNPNGGILAGIGEGINQTDQLQKERNQQMQNNEIKAIELRHLMMNTQKAVAEFYEKKESKLIDQDLHRMQIEATREHRDIAREEKDQARRHRAEEEQYRKMEKGDKSFGSITKLEDDLKALNNLKNIYNDGKATKGFSFTSPLEWLSNKNTPEFKSENQRLSPRLRIPNNMDKEEALQDISSKIEETKQKINGRKHFDDYIQQGLHPYQAERAAVENTSNIKTENILAAEKSYEILIQKGYDPSEAKRAVSERFNLNLEDLHNGDSDE